MLHCNQVRGKPYEGLKERGLKAGMRRIIVLTMACMLLLSGCKTIVPESQPVKKVYTAKTEVGEGLQLEECWTIEGLDNDYLTKTTMVYTYSFDDVNSWEDYLTELTSVLDQRIEELQGPHGSRYINMEYRMDGNLLVVSEITEYEKASKNNEAVMLNDTIDSKEYYSMSKLCGNFDLNKYTLDN